MRHLSIRWRITLWNTVGFAVVLLGFGVLVYSLLRKTHYDQVDASLKARFNELVQDVRLADVPQSQLQEWVRKHPGVLAVVYRPDGQVVARAKSLALVDPLPLVGRRAADPSCDSISLPPLGHVRRLTGRVKKGSDAFTVVFLRDLAHVDEEMGEVVRSLQITAPIALTLAAALAYLLARKSLAPVEHLRVLTDEISADRLDRRLPVASHADEIGLLAQTINSMIGRLERSFTEMRRFTADASHELRTPIAVIRSESEIGLENAPTLEAARDRFGSILEECARLTWMTDQLLTLSREDAGIIVPVRDRVRLLPLIQETTETMFPVAHEKDQSLTATGDDDVVILGDAERLRQVLYNLLANAIKYTGRGGKVEVTLRGHGSEAAIAVRDNGIGIAPEHLPYVFDRFYRVDKGRSQSDGGFGLGLSIVKSIVAAHGGRVEAWSAPGEGSVLTVFLPMSSRVGSTSP